MESSKSKSNTYPLKTSQDAWEENTGDLSGVVCLGWAVCARCVYSTRDLTCKLSGEFERDVCNKKRICPHRKLRPLKPPEQLARELEELEKAYDLPEHEWREWKRKHKDYGCPWSYP